MSLPDAPDLFAQRPFVRFWLARVGGTMANQMLMVALAWQIYDLTSSTWDLGLVGLLQFLPALLMTLPAGQVVDRHDRAAIFAACMLTQAVLAGILLLATHWDLSNRSLILSVSVVLGVARAFQMPAQQALTPALVPSTLLSRAIAFSTSGVQAAIVAGPALGGLIYTRGPVAVYLCCLVLLLGAGFAATRVGHVRLPARQERSDWSTVLAGVVFVWRNKVLLGAITLDLFAVLLGGATALLPVYARDLLRTGPIGLGLLRAAPAVGALLMSLWLTRHPMQRRVGVGLLRAVAVFGLATLVFAVSRDFALSLLALAISGAADSISVVTRNTLTQIDTPDDMRGRVAAVNGVFIGASNQLGEFESGATASWLGPEGSVILGGVGTLLVALVWWRLFPQLAHRDTLAASGRVV